MIRCNIECYHIDTYESSSQNTLFKLWIWWSISIFGPTIPRL